MLSADIISFNRKHLLWALTLARTSCADRLVASFPNWPQRVDYPDYQHLDEPKYLEGLTLSAVESFNTPALADNTLDGRSVRVSYRMVFGERDSLPTTWIVGEASLTFTLCIGKGAIGQGSVGTPTGSVWD